MQSVDLYFFLYAINSFAQIFYSTIPITVPLLSLNELFVKTNNWVEHINIPTKAEERSMIQISFRTQDGNIHSFVLLLCLFTSVDAQYL